MLLDELHTDVDSRRGERTRANGVVGSLAGDQPHQRRPAVLPELEGGVQPHLLGAIAAGLQQDLARQGALREHASQCFDDPAPHASLLLLAEVAREAFGEIGRRQQPSREPQRRRQDLRGLRARRGCVFAHLDLQHAGRERAPDATRSDLAAKQAAQQAPYGPCQRRQHERGRPLHEPLVVEGLFAELHLFRAQHEPVESRAQALGSDAERPAGVLETADRQAGAVVILRVVALETDLEPAVAGRHVAPQSTSAPDLAQPGALGGVEPGPGTSPTAACAADEERRQKATDREDGHEESEVHASPIIQCSSHQVQSLLGCGIAHRGWTRAS